MPGHTPAAKSVWQCGGGWLLIVLCGTVLSLPATAAEPVRDDRPLFRGDSRSSGVARRALADQLTPRWKLPVKNGAFEGTSPVVLQERQEIGAIESKKAESSRYAPLAGELVAFNGALMQDPSAINVDTHDADWLFELRGDGSHLMTAARYVEFLGAVWEVAQRTIKGQLNER